MYPDSKVQARTYTFLFSLPWEVKRAGQWRRRERGRIGRGSATFPPGAEQRTISDFHTRVIQGAGRTRGKNDQWFAISRFSRIFTWSRAKKISDATCSRYLLNISHLYMYKEISIYVQGAGQMEGRTAPPFISQIYKMFTLTVLPEGIQVNYKSLYVLYILRENIYVKKRILHASISFLPLTFWTKSHHWRFAWPTGHWVR